MKYAAVSLDLHDGTDTYTFGLTLDMSDEGSFDESDFSLVSEWVYNSLKNVLTEED